ncbi:MAG: hypothetical protein N3A65_06770 [candidate division WOR-3 bacterium]|nr:hypothetical protein [candidate division WOR-3 bacterium]
MRLFITTFLMVGLMSAGNWLINGDFEEALSTGWTSTQSGSYIFIDRATTYETDPDYEVRVEKGAGNGYARLSQTIDITTPSEFTFSAKAKLYAYDNNADTLTWAAAAIRIIYRNSAGTLLGETRICRFTTPCPWQNTSTIHLILANDTLWNNYSFNLQTELGNLPGVNPANVKKVEIALYDTTAHTC